MQLFIFTDDYSLNVTSLSISVQNGWYEYEQCEVGSKAVTLKLMS